MNMQEILMSSDPETTLRGFARSGDLSALEPSLAALRMSIPKGYHHKDNLEHSIRVLARAAERETRGPDLILRTAALFHDVGKPATRKFESNGVVTFWNHELVGARQVRKILKRHGYTSKQIEEVSRLVALHMRAYGFSDTVWTDSAVRRLTTAAGSEALLDKLLILFVSDLTTKNDKKRRRIERGINRLADAITEVREKDERAMARPALNGHDVMELTGLSQGPELGRIMKFLNNDTLVTKDRDATLEALRVEFPQYF